MALSIMHSLHMLVETRHLKTNVKDEAEASERLSSGFRVNRAADDAAGLTISEKMRSQVKSLMKGTENALNGVSWVQIGDAALVDVHSILHRMAELATASVNDTNTKADRAAMQDEFEQLQQEIDHVTDSANFNTKHIFEDHEATFYQFEGNVQWDYRKLHHITDDNNDLIFRYRRKQDDPEKEISIKVANGVYTTQELIDEIDDALLASGLKEDAIGSSKPHQGQAGVWDDNKGAAVTLDNMHDLRSFAVDGSNDKLKISINGDEKELSIAHASSAADIVNNIQSAIDGAYGTNGAGAVVSLDGNGKLIFTARIAKDDGTPINGAKTSISIDPTGSSFMEALHRNTSTGKFDMYVQNKFTVEAGKDTFSFGYESGGTKETLTVQLAAGQDYSPQDLRDAINAQHGTKITASGSGT